MKVQYKSVVRLLLCPGASARLPALLLGVNRAKPHLDNENPREVSTLCAKAVHLDQPADSGWFQFGA
ncbi:hypothetical protein QIW53_20460 [Pseudomonas fluorescens]|uniref:hypothetical protein n=1 Tax=Pseudomonas fluorescens TaxID=294 RepID=UPI003523F333